MLLPEPIQNLVNALSRLPGVGPKTASRLTFYLLREPNGLAEALAEALAALSGGLSLKLQEEPARPALPPGSQAPPDPQG